MKILAQRPTPISAVATVLLIRGNNSMSMLLLAMAKAVRLKRARRLYNARHSGTEPMIIILLRLRECHLCPVWYAIFIQAYLFVLKQLFCWVQIKSWCKTDHYHSHPVPNCCANGAGMNSILLLLWVLFLNPLSKRCRGDLCIACDA